VDITAIEREIAALQHLFALSQTESLMLDEGNIVDVAKVVAKKAEIVEYLLEKKTEIKHDSAEMNSLRRNALDLIARITAIDTKNRSRLEQLRSESVLGLQEIHNRRQLANTYSSGCE